jgi:hypothetical protein
MRVDLDGEFLEVARPTLAEALKAGIAAAERRGVLIVGVTADGRTLEGSELEQHSDVPGVFASVSLLAASPGLLVERTLREAAAAVDEIRASQARVAELVDIGDTTGALEHLKGVFATWSAVREVIDRGGRLLGRDLMAMEPASIDAKRPVEACMLGLTQGLQEVKRALETDDWSLLSDVVGHRLEALATDWSMVLGALADEIAGDGGGR